MTTLEFLEANGMTADEICIPKHAENFAREFSAALRGEKTRFEHLPSRLGVPGIPRNTKKLLAIDLGGTNIRVAEVSFDGGGKLRIENYFQEKILTGSLEKDEFFGWLADQISRSELTDVGLVFSYRAEILPNGDARIVGLSKGLYVPDAIGCVIGEEINRILEARGLARRRFTVINDTTAVFLAGAATLEEPELLAAAVIAGTGSNCCCVYEGEIINIEWVLFTDFPSGRYDRILDENSENRGKHLTGKLTGGKYLAMLVDMCLEGAMEAGTEETRGGAEGVQAARDIIYDCIYKRSAIYVTAMLRGVVDISPALKAAVGKSREIWVCIEGGTYDNAPGYKEYLNGLIEKYIAKAFDIKCHIIQVDQAAITGAAIAALRK